MLPQSLPGDIRCFDTFKSRFPTQNPGKAPCLARTDRLDGNQRPLVPRFGSFFPQNPHAHFEVPISVEIILRGCRDNDGLGGSARRFLRGLCIYQGTTAQSQFQNHPKLPLCTQLEAQFWKKNSCFPSPRAAQVPPCFWDGNSPKKSRNVEPIHHKLKQQFGINKCEWSFPAGKEDHCFPVLGSKGPLEAPTPFCASCKLVFLLTASMNFATSRADFLMATIASRSWRKEKGNTEELRVFCTKHNVTSQENPTGGITPSQGLPTHQALIPGDSGTAAACK